MNDCTSDISGQSSWVNSNNVCCFFCPWKLRSPFMYKLRNFTWCHKWDGGWYVGTWVVLVKKLCGLSGLCCWFIKIWYGMSQYRFLAWVRKFGMHLKFHVGQNVDGQIWNLPHPRKMGRTTLFGFGGPWIFTYLCLDGGWGLSQVVGLKFFTLLLSGWRGVRRTNLFEFVCLLQVKINFSIGNIFCRVVSWHQIYIDL